MKFFIAIQLLLLSTFSLVSLRASVPEHYNYDHQGNDWTGTCATGEKQSPIDLIYDRVVIKSIPRIRFHYYNENLQTPLYLVNNGHTANMVLPPTRGGWSPYINGGLLPGDFDAQSVHFHWGSKGSHGSEHAVGAQRYDVEMHIVHKNIKYATLSVSKASKYPDGLAVLGIFLTGVPKPPSEHYGLYKIFNALPQIIKYESNTTISGRLTAGQLLGNIVTGEFYSYNGSLSSPDCAEAVTWTVFSDVIQLPEREIRKLWKLQDPRGLSLINNYRTLQNINGRQVFLRTLN